VIERRGTSPGRSQPAATVPFPMSRRDSGYRPTSFSIRSITTGPMTTRGLSTAPLPDDSPAGSEPPAIADLEAYVAELTIPDEILHSIQKLPATIPSTPAKNHISIRCGITWRNLCGAGRDSARGFRTLLRPLDRETGMGFSRQWWLLSISERFADLVFLISDQGSRCYTCVEHPILCRMSSLYILHSRFVSPSARGLKGICQE
jgi:hypothetical protein